MPLTYDEFDPNAKLFRSLMFYGASGVGKTRLACQLPKPLVLACDPGNYGGLLSGKDFLPKFVVIKSYQQLLSLLPDLEKEAGISFETLVIDSLTYLQRIILDDLLARTGKEKPTFDEWGLCQSRTRNFIVKTSGYNCHFVMTATEQIDKDEIIGKLMGTPDLIGKLAREVPQAVDTCLRLYVDSGFDNKGNKRTLYKMTCAPDSIWFAKDRTDLVPKDCETSFENLKRLFE